MILATICCRGGSKGVPNKNLRLMHGIPLIGHTIRQAQQSELIADLIISTDTQQIADIAREYGAKVPFMRPGDLASDSASKWPVFIHALEFYEKEYGQEVEYLVDLDVTVPLKTPQDIDGAIQLALDNPTTEVVITGYEPERNPYFNMMEIREDGLAEIVKKSDKPIVRRQDAPDVYSLSPAAFVIKKSALYNYPHWSKAPCRIFPIPRERAIDIDSLLDFELVEFLMGKQQ
ncbi:acylneuraminate cytidylyltransferase family protein [Algoriphagus persicinus]|uniref:acylneuraminate cytidylyltransferase family protein n=1 Tax=Algoriphagus persicinus TaxID=3108754 RepID=UPI002B388CA6|nr:MULTISPECIES: acylneuraminate cytidylyltransferase family protein [unclassified Algoriphagus]MEB2779604.1 acylneuraminate cytidylyltransferase family protein [Algoriphagus sp. C2-6-M1]MEB2785129.1 acylneuraminate cytidylyltransferase family protein [Algoriphagus sp. E1-3-M2]